MYKYELSAIDFFDGCVSLAEFLKEYGHSDENTIITKLAVAMSEMKTKSFWQGDIREGIYVFCVPDVPDDYSNMRLGFIWKQDNNGETFVVCERELPWLSEHIVE